MSTQTENIGLVKQTENEHYDIEIANENLDKIDTQLGNKANLDHNHNAAYLALNGGTVNGMLEAVRNGEVLKLKPGSENSAFYLAWYKNLINRSGYLGYGSTSNNHLSIVNELSNGDLLLNTNGGSVKVNGNKIPLIDDNLSLSTEKVWSINKITQKLTEKANTSHTHSQSDISGLEVDPPITNYTNFNSATKVGFFKATATASNRPVLSSTNLWYSGIVMRENDGTVVQIVGSVNDTRLWTRKLLSNVWSSWIEILTSDRLTSSVNDSSTSKIATANAVKTAYDKASLNATNISNLQNELGSNKTNLQNNINKIREVL